MALGALQDPFAQPTAPTGSATPAPATAATTPALSASCEHITTAVCEKQNASMLGTAAGYVAVCVIVISVWRHWWNKRGTSKAGAVFFVPMVLGGTAAGTLAGLDPARGQDLACCLGSPVFKATILLQDSSIGRAFLFGVLPTIVLYTLVTFVVGLFKR